MKKTQISLVAAMDKNRGIGFAGDMPWHLPGELQHFKAITMGKSIIMGRRTWESIGRALPGRQNIVISSNPALQTPGCDLVSDFDQALAIATGGEVMVIGGGMLYQTALPYASRMVLSLVDGVYPADTWFPQWEARAWQEISRKTVTVDDGVSSSYAIVEYQRVSALPG